MTCLGGHTAVRFDFSVSISSHDTPLLHVKKKIKALSPLGAPLQVNHSANVQMFF